jgi:hypothetical protein
MSGDLGLVLNEGLRLRRSTSNKQGRCQRDEADGRVGALLPRGRLADHVAW